MQLGLRHFGLALGLLFGLAHSASVSAGETKPNILMILTDDQGWGDVTCQGAKDLQTPNMDKLFASGMTWTQFYANSCVCSPTRAALLTGRYPELVGVPGVIRTQLSSSWGHLSEQAILLPQLLRQVGYHTAIIGKWHLGLESPNTPTERGFDFFHGFLGDMMDDYYNHRRHGNNYMRKNKKEIDPKGHATDLFSDWAVDYIRSRKEAKNPFFLYLAYNAPHTPIQPPADWLKKVREREPNISGKRAKLVALIEHLDAGIGRVIAALKETGQYDNTLIIFSSDNGGDLGPGAFNGPWRNGKGSMYEGGLRVPTCVVWPGHVKEGTRTDVPAITMDFYPTICAAAGAKVKHNIEGVSLLPILTGAEKTLAKRDLFYVRREGGKKYDGKTIHAFRRGDWKLVQNWPGAPFELFNLKNDPQEKHDVREKYRAKYAELAPVLQANIERGNAIEWRHPEKRKE